MSTFRYDALISYRREEPDKSFARELLSRLESAGLAVAFDEQDFDVASTFLEEMERCIKESRFTLAVVSPRYLESGNCKEEAIICKVLDMAERRRRLIPLIIEKVEMPTWLFDIVGIDFTDEDALLNPHDRLVEKLRQSGLIEGTVAETRTEASLQPPGADPAAQPNRATISLDPLESREWYQQSRLRLQKLAEEVLDESPVTRKFILTCNRDLPETLDAETLAAQIFNSDTPPITYLRKCANQKRHKEKLSEVECLELSLHLYRLIDFVSPMCFRVEDLHTLEPYVNRKVGNHANITTKETTVATSQVACIKGVSADLNKHSDWSAFGLTRLSDSREIVSHLPPPPEMGRQATGKENPIDAFVAVLAKAIHPDQPTLPHVKARLQSLATYDEIFFIVLFDTHPGDAYLNELHKTFPELILLVAEEVEQPSDALPTPDVSLAVDIHVLRKEFGPQDPNT